MATAHTLRRAQARREVQPRGSHSLFGKLSVAQFTPNPHQEISGEPMKAQCKRLADRSVLVGKTVFAFDRDGVCDVKAQGRGGYTVDFAELLKLNGVFEIKEPVEPIEPIEDEPIKAEPIKAEPIEEKVDVEVSSPDPVEATSEPVAPPAEEEKAEAPPKKIKRHRRKKKEND